MLLPKGGVTWKSAKARLTPYEALLRAVLRTRFLPLAVVVSVVLLLWRGLSGTAGEMQRLGPTKIYPRTGRPWADED